MKFRKKPIVIEATQWFHNGDHAEGQARTEGNIVPYFHPGRPGISPCAHCDKLMQAHGWIDTLEGGHIVCPGDWVITGIKGEHYPCKPDIFSNTYEPAE